MFIILESHVKLETLVNFFNLRYCVKGQQGKELLEITP